MSGEIRRNSCCWGMLHSIWNASRSMLVTCLRVLVGSFQSWFVSPQMHSYDIWYRLSYLCIYIYTQYKLVHMHKYAQLFKTCTEHESYTCIFNEHLHVCVLCMHELYIYTYMYIYIYIHIHISMGIYIYMIRYWDISIYHMHRFRISHPCGLPQPQASGNLWLLRQGTWGRTWWVGGNPNFGN